MKAMVLAAGLGTRLRPLTNKLPKALVEINGRTLLEIALTRLRDAGVREAIVNVHHFADMMADFLSRHDFGMRVEVSREDVLLDTGGGLKKAAPFFLESPGEPFFLHNVDVISSIDLGAMLAFHRQQRALATLAVQRRPSSRLLLFDNDSRLRGRHAGPKNEPASPRAFAFCGIHVISPRIFDLMTEEGVFSIIDVYVRLAAQGENIVGFFADQYAWRDLGTPESLARAAQDAPE